MPSGILYTHMIVLCQCRLTDRDTCATLVPDWTLVKDVRACVQGLREGSLNFPLSFAVNLLLL